MCGIAGVFGRGDAGTLAAMLGTIVHRGPDDGHAVSGTDFALGARRLSIVDVAGGRQPVTNERGTVWAAQNGELYNFQDVRGRLSAAGHRLHTRCDTEVLPHLWEEHGPGLAERVDGMFAVAVWDDEAKVGLLVRDRTGKKPLYYHLREGCLYFASEIKALLRIPGFERRLDLVALHHFLGLKHVPHPRSIFEGIRVLPPAHLLLFRPGQAPVVRRYWDVSFATDAETAALGEDEVVERLRALLEHGVARRLMSDVPVGFFLSGGIDSSLSTALAAEAAGTRLKTFCLTYGASSSTPGKEEDRRWARWVAARYGTEHHEETIEARDLPETLRAIVQCFDEPFAGVVSTYFLAQLIARHVKVALSGDGADELFGSYLSHRLAALSAGGDAAAADDARLRRFGVERGLAERAAGLEDWDWRARLLVFSDEEKEALYAPDVAAALADVNTREYLRAAFARATATDPLNRMLEVEFRTILPDEVLTFVDRLSMAHSLEVRTAYLDTELVRFVARLPGALKIRDGETKYVLKRLATRYFPPEMVFRRKEGFLMPIAQWVRRDLLDYVRETLHPERLAKHALFDARQVQALVDALARGEGGYAQVNKVLALVVFQEWYELYMV